MSLVVGVQCWITGTLIQTGTYCWNVQAAGHDPITDVTPDVWPQTAVASRADLPFETNQNISYLTSLSNQVISADPAGDEGPESVICGEQAQLAAAQQVFVALAGGREVESSAEVVEVNMYDLLNNSVTFICEDKQPCPDSEAWTLRTMTPDTKQFFWSDHEQTYDTRTLYDLWQVQ